MSDQPIKAILVDLDGVLRLWPDDTRLIEENHGLPLGAIEKCAFSAPQLIPAIRGVISDADWRQSVSKELLRIYPQSDACNAVRLWSASKGKLDPSAIQAISRYKSDVRLVLSTNATSRLESDLEALGILDIFYGIANSSDLGFVKPEPAFYQVALEIADSLAGETIYIDDSLENVRAAQAMDIRSHHFNDVKGLEFFLSRSKLKI